MSKVKVPLLSTVVLFLVTTLITRAAPPLPSSFYGLVTLDGAAVSAGTLVTAWVDGIYVAESPTFVAKGNSVVSLLNNQLSGTLAPIGGWIWWLVKHLMFQLTSTSS